MCIAEDPASVAEDSQAKFRALHPVEMSVCVKNSCRSDAPEGIHEGIHDGRPDNWDHFQNGLVSQVQQPQTRRAGDVLTDLSRASTLRT